MRAVLPAIVCALWAFGCEKVDYIELLPAEIILKQPNNQVFVEARPMSRQGARATRVTVNWATGDGEVAKVTNKGQVTPVGDGETEVIARVGDVEARVPVRVIYVDRVEVEPKELRMVEGQEAQPITVSAFRKNGKPIVDRSVVMMAKDKQVAQVVGGGKILPLDPGTTTVDVQVDNARASFTVVVEEEPKKKK